MKIVLTSLGMYFIGSIICTIFTIIFVQGWGTFGAIAAIVIPSYLWSWGFHIGMNNIIELLVEPNLIDSKNFYALLPLIGIISSIIGSYVGFRLSKSKKMLLK